MSNPNVQFPSEAFCQFDFYISAEQGNTTLGHWTFLVGYWIFVFKIGSGFEPLEP